MTSITGKLPGLDIELIQGAIEPVYRYHFARCENYLEAQNLTILTLSTAAEWIAAGRTRPENIKTWVMGIARDHQAFGSRHQNQVSRRLGGAQPPADPEPLSPEQSELFLRDRMSHLSSSWKRLPASQADALALYYFGGLSLLEIGAILNKSEAAVKALIGREAAFEAELLELAASIHPSQDFINRLQYAPRSLPRGASSWRPGYAARHKFFRASAYLAQAALLLGVLVFGFYIIQRQSITPVDTTTPPAPTAATTEGKPTSIFQSPTPPTPVDTPVDNPGNLVPPSSSVCQQWRATLAELIGQKDVSISNVAFNDPTQSNLPQPNIDSKGIGCLVETTVINWDLHGAWATFDSISSLLFAQNFDQVGDAGYPGYGDTNYFDQGCYGLGRTFTNSDTRAILTASWCNPNQPAAGPGTPQPTISSPAIALDLGGGSPQSIGIRPYILRLVLASNNLDSFLGAFFKEWSDGNPSITTFLAPGLLKLSPNINALDRLVGIPASLNQKVAFSWQVIDNSGSSLRVFVKVFKEPWQGAPGAPPDTQAVFQMTIALDGSTWTVRSLGETVPFLS